MDQAGVILNHLAQEYREPVKDPVWRNILLSRGLMRIVSHRAFQKLNGIKQLGPTYLVYPGASHTRLSHSLGVFHLARRMLQHLLSNGGGERLRLGVSLEATKAFLCAALLHDLGHYPYAHSLKDLDVRDHESLTAERVLQPDLSGLIREELGADPRLVAAIVDSSVEYTGEENVRFFRNLLSGVLDPDKLDYLSRDAYFCGVPHGTQDVDFVLAEIRLHREGMAVTEKGLSAVESILFAKYLMYKTVYWHKTVRIATAMIKKAVLLALREQVLRPAELYWLDDHEFYALTDRHPFAPLRLIGRVFQRRLFKLVAAVSFDPGSTHHRRLQELSARLDFEQTLAREAGKRLGRPVPAESVLIDIPEPISFDVRLPVLKAESRETVPYEESGSVFNRDSVRAFRDSLRTVTLIAEDDEELVGTLLEMGGRLLLLDGLR